MDATQTQPEAHKRTVSRPHRQKKNSEPCRLYTIACLCKLVLLALH